MTALQPRPTTTWTEQVFSRRQARTSGWTEDEMRAAITSGRWTVLRRGLYCRTEDLESAVPGRRFHLELLALQHHLARPAAVVSHATAARLHGLLLPRGAAEVHRLTDPDRWRAGDGYRMTRAVLPAEEVSTVGPFPVTTVARTLADCSRSWPELAAVAVLDDALLKQEVTTASILAVLDRAVHTPGTPAARRAVARADGRAESWLETAWRLRHLAAGLPVPQLQVEIRAGGRLVKVVDGWLPDHAVAIECDGRVEYSDPYGGRDPADVLWQEKRAEDALRSLGIRVWRVLASDVRGGWPAFEARTRREVTAPVPVLRPFEAVPRARGRVRPRTSRALGG